MSRALVTGGHGFVGSHLAAGLLAAGTAVRVLDRPAPRQADVGGERRSGLELLGIAAAFTRRDGDCACELGEMLAAASVDNGLFMLDRVPFGVSGHHLSV